MNRERNEYSSYSSGSRRDRSRDKVEERFKRDRSRERERERSRSQERSRRNRSPIRRDRERSLSPSRRKYDYKRRSRSRSQERIRNYSPEYQRSNIEDKSLKSLPLQPNKIQNEKLAVLKKLTTNEGESDNEDSNNGIKQNKVNDNLNLQNDEVIDEKEIQKIMGFTGFDSTKNKPVDDNFHGAAVGGASHHKKRVYRQYMNRKGGFNRPLQKMD